jgi:predicted small metal-binding protein
MIKVYVSEKTASRRPGLRLVCTCGWGVVAVHHDQALPIAEVIDQAMAHAETHGIDEIRGRKAVIWREIAVPSIEPR